MSVTHIPELRIELGPAAQAVERAGRRVADLLERQDDPGRGVTGLEWSIAETAAHLAGRTGRLAAYLAGSAAPEGPGLRDRGRERAGRPRTRGPTLSEHVEELRGQRRRVRGVDPRQAGFDPYPWYSGWKIDVATATGLLLGELDIHGFDVARTVGAPWEIRPADGRTIVRAAVVLAPLYVDPEATRGVSVTFRIAVGEGPRSGSDSTTGRRPSRNRRGGRRHDPRRPGLPLALLSYGRVSKWRAMATGKLFATGRRPWAALDFDRFFLPP